MIVDCIPFFNELDVLEVRLNALAPYVDRFVITECTVTHSGNPKPLYFNENKDRFKQFNITHLICPPPDRDMKSVPGTYSGNAWRLEHRDREYLMTGIQDLDPEDFVILSDADEIPDVSKYRLGDEGAFKQKVYYYYFNCRAINHRPWKGSIILKKKNIKTMNHTRNHRGFYPTIVNSGWHFSTLGTPDQIRYKIESVAHQELNTPYFKGNIEESRKALVDPYGGWRPGMPEVDKEHPKNWLGRNIEMKIEEPDGPEWLLKNRERYGHLFYKALPEKEHA